LSLPEENRVKFDITIIIGCKDGEYHPLELIDVDTRSVINHRLDHWENEGYEVRSEDRRIEVGVDKKTGELVWLD
jgi:hypothetical protein|tara:strand:- start:9606 stop:9830 length:225 start_codon:yes stop_codon:yes gene_type:complete